MGESLIYGAIGFVVGGILGGFLVGRLCARKYSKRLEELQNERDQLIDEGHKTAEKGLLERERGLVEAEKKLDDKLATIGSHPKKNTTEKRANRTSLKTLEDLSKEYGSESFDEHFADRVGPEDDEPDDEDDDLDVEGDDTVEVCEAESNDDIVVITAEQFKKDVDYRDTETITYYQEDDVLTDSAQEVLHDQAGILGDEVMGMINDTDQDFIYIDNGPDDVLYEVIVEHSMSYYRDVLGV